MGKMKLGFFYWPCGHHIAAWRHPHGTPDCGVNLPHNSAESVPLQYRVPAYRMNVQVALTNKVPVTPVPAIEEITVAVTVWMAMYPAVLAEVPVTRVNPWWPIESCVAMSVWYADILKSV